MANFLDKSLGNCPFDSELVLLTRMRKVDKKKEQHAGRLEIRNASGADWMVDMKYIIYAQNTWSGQSF